MHEGGVLEVGLLRDFFQYSIGDARSAWEPGLRFCCTGSTFNTPLEMHAALTAFSQNAQKVFQYSIGDASSSRISDDPPEPDDFQYSIGDARRLTASTTGIATRASFNTPLEMRFKSNAAAVFLINAVFQYSIGDAGRFDLDLRCLVDIYLSILHWRCMGVDD